MRELIFYLLTPLLFTLLIELGVGILINRDGRFLLTIVEMNVITNPLMNLVRSLLYQWFGWTHFVVPIAEIGVWGYEAAYIKVRHHWSGTKEMGISLLLNASSFFCGLLLRL